MNDSIIGRGWAFPFRLNSSSTAPEFTEDEQRVREQIEAVLSVDINERPFRVRSGVPYGTRIQNLLFESPTLAKDVAKSDTKRALDVWVPSIVVMSVTADLFTYTDLSVIKVKVTFRHRSTGRVDNFTIPYRTKPVEDDRTTP